MWWRLAAVALLTVVLEHLVGYAYRRWYAVDTHGRQGTQLRYW